MIPGPTPWHLDGRLIDAYARGSLDFASEASVEAHLLACADCRALVAPAVDTGRLDAVWDDIVLAVDAPAPPLVERLLRRAGADEVTARLAATAPSLRLPWLGGTALCLLFAVAAASTSGPLGLLVFLCLAPLLPVAGVAVAYGPQTDPTYELQVAAPYSTLRLLLLRSGMVLVVTLPVAALAGLLLPSPVWVAAAWLLPALAMTTLTLALSTYADLLWSGVAIALTWVTLVGGAFAATREPVTVFGGAGQLAYLAVTVASLAVLFGRREHILMTRRSL